MKVLLLDDDQARVLRAAIALLRTTAADAASDFGVGKVREEALRAVEGQMDAVDPGTGDGVTHMCTCGDCAVAPYDDRCRFELALRRIDGRAT